MTAHLIYRPECHGNIDFIQSDYQYNDFVYDFPTYPNIAYDEFPIIIPPECEIDPFRFSYCQQFQDNRRVYEKLEFVEDMNQKDETDTGSYQNSGNDNDLEQHEEIEPEDTNDDETEED